MARPIFFGTTDTQSYPQRKAFYAANTKKNTGRFALTVIFHVEILDQIMSETFEEIVETFEFLDDWEDRYRHVIELGRAMTPLDTVLKVSATKVDGCASQVWIVPKIDGAGPQAILDFDGESDAMIVNGLIAILKALYAGNSVENAVKIDALSAFARLGLDQHLSAQRSNGLRAMIERLRAVSQAANLT